MLSWATWACYTAIIPKEVVQIVNKQDLIQRVSQQASLPEKDATAAVNAVWDTIRESLANGEKVQIVGFGAFETRERAARSGRNPLTGETIQIAAVTIPAFKAGKDLKAAVLRKK